MEPETLEQQLKSATERAEAFQEAYQKEHAKNFYGKFEEKLAVAVTEAGAWQRESKRLSFELRNALNAKRTLEEENKQLRSAAKRKAARRVRPASTRECTDIPVLRRVMPALPTYLL